VPFGLTVRKEELRGEAHQRHDDAELGSQFTCFTWYSVYFLSWYISTKVQKLTQKAILSRPQQQHAEHSARA
jgi:hypothetical protein